VLTNCHVMAPVLEQQARPQDVICRFDYSKKEGGSPASVGVECQLADGAWCVASSPPGQGEVQLDGPNSAENELDYCLLRLADPVGEAALGGVGDTTAPKRGWLKLVPGQSVGKEGQQLFVFGHPWGDLLKLSIGDHRGCNQAGTTSAMT
jgi:hypothetical protein